MVWIPEMVPGWSHNMLRQITIAKSKTVSVDDGKFSKAVNEYIFAYGLKQVLNDAGSQGKSAEDKLALAEKKLAKLYSGDLAIHRTTDPVAAEAKKIAIAKVNAAIAKKGKKPEDVENIGELVAKVMTQTDVQAEAKRRVDAANAVEIDLDDLL
jgi:hypothetical protein